MSTPYYLHYQAEGKESPWLLAVSTDRAKIIQEQQPTFVTVLDYTGVPKDGDWSKAKYRGPFYADFDADGDLELVCDSFRTFLGKLYVELQFDLEQAKLFASGGKGFHIEIPSAAFNTKPDNGVAWLPYVYRVMAESLVVDTMDLAVYSAKRGRQWRTPGVKRENGNYKIQLTLEEAMSVNPDTYLDMVSRPRDLFEVSAPTLNAGMQLRYSQAKEEVASKMRNKAKRVKAANALLEPWLKAQKTPPTIQQIMRGDGLAEGVGFQRVAMQLSIYAASTGMDQDNFLLSCEGLIHKHEGDGFRYKGAERRRAELIRMWDYMQGNELYDFERDPLVKLLAPGCRADDLGLATHLTDSGDVIITETVPLSVDSALALSQTRAEAKTATDAAPQVRTEAQELAQDAEYKALLVNLTKGVQQTAHGVLAPRKEGLDLVGAFRVQQVCDLVDLEDISTHGGNSSIDSGWAVTLLAGRRIINLTLKTKDLSSAASLRNKLLPYKLVYAGDDGSVVALTQHLMNMSMDTNPRYQVSAEGLHLIKHPQGLGRGPKKTDVLVPVYVGYGSVSGELLVRQAQRDEAGWVDLPPLEMQFGRARSTTTYGLSLCETTTLSEWTQANGLEPLSNLFRFNEPRAVSLLLGWFTACHFRQLYTRYCGQFPILQVFGEAGAGKTQTIMLMSRLHYTDEHVEIRSASGLTPYALDMLASGSVSAPLLLDEYKPREMRPDRVARIKDLVKNSYTGNTVGERGTINHQTNELSTVAARANAPLALLTEGLESETAIMERSVVVEMRKAYHTPERSDALYALTDAEGLINAVGRSLIDAAFMLSVDGFKASVLAWRNRVREKIPRNLLADRPAYNLAVVCHALDILRAVLNSCHPDANFDEQINRMQEQAMDLRVQQELGVVVTSEASKVLTALAWLSHQTDNPHLALQSDQDYVLIDDKLDLDLASAYVKYRRHCVSLGDKPLYDTPAAFVVGLRSHPAVTERRPLDSLLPNGANSAQIVRFSLLNLIDNGVPAFLV